MTHKLLSKWSFLLLLPVIIILKFLFIPLTSHPFDFASYVFQIRQIYDLGIDPFFYWNKGIILWLVFWVSYFSFDILMHVSFLAKMPVELYHTVFKLPLLLFDLGTAFLIWKIVLLLSNKRKEAVLAVCLWMTNPLVFWTTQIHGSYVVMVTFFVTLFFYLLIKKRQYSPLISLAVATSIYYFPAILFPIYFLRDTYNSKSFLAVIKRVARAALFFLLILMIFFSPFLFSQTRASWMISSVLHHAQPDSPHDVTETKIPVLSLFNFPYYLINDTAPSNIESPSFYNLFAKSTFVSIATVLLAYLYLIYNLFKRTPIQNLDRKILEWILIFTLLFMVFLGKFQAHYILWVLSLLTVYIVVYKKYILLIPLTIISLLPQIIALSTQNLGIFFLDSLKWGTISFITGIDQKAVSFLGFLVMFSLLFICGHLFAFSRGHKKESEYSAQEKTSWIMGCLALYLLTIFSFSIAVLPTAYTSRISQVPQNTLASENRVLSYSFIVSPKGEYLKYDHSILLTDIKGFTFQPSDSASRFFGATNSSNRVYFYNVTKSQNLLASSSLGGLDLDFKEGNTKAQISFGSSGSQFLLPLKAQRSYEVTFNVFASSTANLLLTPSARFGDLNKKIIAPSTAKPVESVENGNSTYSLDVYTTNVLYKFFEPLLTIQWPEGVKGSENEVILSRIQVKQLDTLNTMSYGILLPSNSETINENIIQNKKAKGFFYISINIKSDRPDQTVSSIYINDCNPMGSLVQAGQATFKFDVDCVKTNEENLLKFDIKNIGNSSLGVSVSLLHNVIPRVDFLKGL